jgi:hypothetical protein
MKKLTKITIENLATVTGGIDCDSLRGASGRFKPENALELQQVGACLDAGHPPVKKLF